MILADTVTTITNGSSGTNSDHALTGGGGAAAIVVVAIVVLGLLGWFYYQAQQSPFLSDLLGIGDKGTGKTVSSSAYRFAEEFLARRAEFWVLYAQFAVVTFAVAVIAALILSGKLSQEAGLPALSTIVGIVLGKTLLSAKGTPLSAQESPANAQPHDLEPPSIAASADPPVVGTTLTADPGLWDEQGTMRFLLQWRRLKDKKDVPIPDATEETYVLVADDLGSQIAVAVTAVSPAGGVTTRMSARTTIPPAA